MNKKFVPRQDLAGLKPYSVPKVSAKIKLDANESPFNLPFEIISEIKSEFDGFLFNRYPDPLSTGLKRKIANYYGLSEECVGVGNGADEIIECLLLAYGGRGRMSLAFEPTFSMYQIISKITATEFISLRLDNSFSISLDKTISTIKRFKPYLIFICSPNNPSGNIAPKKTIEEILNQTDALVIVDEAYGEFSKQSVVDLLGSYPNLVVLRTFSKVFCLASLRVGYMLADSEIVTELNKVRLPYSYNSFSQMAAAKVFERRDIFDSFVEKIISERERIMKALREMKGVYPFPSDANFILFRTEINSDEVFKKLLGYGILTRSFEGDPLLENCLRVTVGSAEENNEFLKALERITQE
ncbi:MAG: histidinol-phosphate transaminase [Actinobacteria bacterium]|nr:histidinol-phosphate transaminase [Actinomycetota bacterium]